VPNKNFEEPFVRDLWKNENISWIEFQFLLNKHLKRSKLNTNHLFNFSNAENFNLAIKKVLVEHDRVLRLSNDRNKEKLIKKYIFKTLLLRMDSLENIPLESDRVDFFFKGVFSLFDGIDN